MHRRAVKCGHDQARAVGAKRRVRHVAQVRAFQPRDNAAGLCLDDANDLAVVLNGQSLPIRREAQSATADLPCLEPGSDGPQVTRRHTRQEPLSLGTEENSAVLDAW